MSAPLFRLTPRGARAVLRDWLPSPESEPPLGDGALEPAGAEWLPERALARAASLRMELPVRDPALDARFAADLYEALPISRVLARDDRIWRWLAVGPLRSWMLHRWPLNAEREPRPGRVERWLGGVKVHGLARLWWAAELTRSRQGYGDTLRLLGNPCLLDRALGSGLARAPHVVGGLVDALGDADRETVSRAWKALGIRAATLCIEALDRREIAELARSL